MTAIMGVVEPTKRQLFPLKLWDLVNLPDPYNPGVKWSDNGTNIIVDRQSLQNSYLKKDDTIFRTRSVDSFIRQLHFYGFRKTVGPKESDNVVYYRHECFRRDNPELLLRMRRQYKSRRPCSEPAHTKADIKEEQEKPVVVYAISEGPLDPQALWPDQLVLYKTWRGPYHVVEAQFIYSPKPF